MCVLECIRHYYTISQIRASQQGRCLLPLQHAQLPRSTRKVFSQLFFVNHHITFITSYNRPCCFSSCHSILGVLSVLFHGKTRHTDDIVRQWPLKWYLLEGTADTIERQVRAHAHEVVLRAITLHLTAVSDNCQHCAHRFRSTLSRLWLWEILSCHINVPERSHWYHSAWSHHHRWPYLPYCSRSPAAVEPQWSSDWFYLRPNATPQPILSRVGLTPGICWGKWHTSAAESKLELLHNPGIGLIALVFFDMFDM